MKALKKNLPNEVREVLERGYIPVKRGYHASKKKGRPHLDPEKLYFGVEFEVAGRHGLSPVIPVIFGDMGFSCEHDATVQAEYVLPPIPATVKHARDLYGRMLRAIEISKNFFDGGIDIDETCGLHHHFSIPQELLYETTHRSPNKSVPKRWRTLNAMLWYVATNIQEVLREEVNDDITYAEKLFGRNFGGYRDLLDIYYDSELIEDAYGFNLFMRGLIDPVAEIMDRHSWINFVNLNANGIGTIEYRIPVLRTTLKQNVEMFKLLRLLHTLFIRVFRWVKNNIRDERLEDPIITKAIAFCDKVVAKFVNYVEAQIREVDDV